MSTVLHLPTETDTVLQLYDGDMDEPFYSSHGFYGLSSFRELGKRIGIVTKQLERILIYFLSKSEEVNKMVANSGLSDNLKKNYVDAFKGKLRRMEMMPDE